MELHDNVTATQLGEKPERFFAAHDSAFCTVRGRGVSDQTTAPQAAPHLPRVTDETPVTASRAEGKSSSPDIFLSYSQKHAARAKEVANALSASGWDVWWDVNLYAGARFRPPEHDAALHVENAGEIKGKVVSRTFASWNQLDGWLRRVEALSRAA
jgi:hypothetical protein